MHLILLLISCLLAGQTLVFAKQTEDIKQVDRHRRSCGCQVTPPQIAAKPTCPQNVAEQMTASTIQQLCHSLNDQNVPLIQGGIITENATFASTSFDPQLGRCVRSDPQQYLVGLYPFFAQSVQCLNINVLATFFLDNGKVLVQSNCTTGVGQYQETSRISFTFKPVSEGSCIYKLSEQKVVSYQCL